MTLLWYVLRTKPRCDFSTAEQLSREGFSVYCPRLKSPSPSNDTRYVPLFPGYLFLEVDMETRDAELPRQKAGILGWLRLGDDIPTVPTGIISDIRQWVDEINKGAGVLQSFRIGQKVRLIHGNLDSLGEVIEDTPSSNGQVQIVLNFLGRVITASVPWHKLQPVSDQTTTIIPVKGNRRTRGRGRWIQGHGPRAAQAIPS
jgi:transcriptional antiterminator RfaH